MAASLVLAFLLLVIEKFFIRTSVIHYAVNILLLAVLAVGKRIGGAKSWFRSEALAFNLRNLRRQVPP